MLAWLSPAAPAAPAAASAAPPRVAARAASVPAPGPDALADPGKQLNPGWRSSQDKVVAVQGDESGLHVLVANEATGYLWQTIATLGDPGVETSLWIGQACVSGDGRYAVVLYAPREVTNMAGAMGVLGRAVIVNLASGAVRQLGGGFSLAYFDPGCGTGDQVVLTRGGWGGDTPALPAATRLQVINAATGATSLDVTVPGQATSAVPYKGQIAAAYGGGISEISRGGRVRVLTQTSGLPFRLVTDGGGGLGFETQASGRVQLHRMAAAGVTQLGSGAIGSLQLAAQGGRVWVTGPSSPALRNLPADWRPVAAPSGSIVSTAGTLVATRVSSVGVKKQRPGDPQPVQIQGQLLQGSRAHVKFTVPAASEPASSSASRTSLTSRKDQRGAALANTAGSANTPVSADRTCGIAIDDPSIQAYQPDFSQVEWAADQTVRGTLTNTRPAGLYGSALPSYTPQGMFPLPSLSGGGSIPAQLLLGVLTQESNLQQASAHVIQGQASNPLTSFNWYGNWQQNNTVETDQINWSKADCGYGIGQVTSGMCIATYANNDQECQYGAPLSGTQQLAIAVDYQTNIAKAAQMLAADWNQLQADGITMNGGQSGASNSIENWYMALWAYNSGLEPGNSSFGNTTGCTPGPACTDGNGDWGLGYADNPANPAYPPDRPVFPNGSPNNYTAPGGGSYSPAWDMSHPAYWTYQEKVISWAFDAVTLWDYNKQADVQAFAYAHGNAAYPPTGDFCTSANNCNVSVLNPTNANPNHTDPCQLTGSYQDHCWWHWPVTWTGDCTSGSCGTSVFTFSAGAADPGVPAIAPEFAPDCALGSNLTGHSPVIVGADKSALGCPGQNWTNGGPMTWNFAAAANGTYPSKIFFDQIGAGFGGHFWFTYTIQNDGSSDLSTLPNVTDPERAVTGTWPAPSSVTGWNEILVHIPSYGAWAVDANYQINPGGAGTIEQRVINQAKQANTWVNLGIFDLKAGASVSLSNVTNSGGGRDIAWNDVAFLPATLLGSYVAMGDSYSSGEGVSPYNQDSDYSYNGMVHSCHRSLQAYPYAVTWGGHALPIATEAANPATGETFAFTACTGAETNSMSWDYPVVGDPSAGSEAGCGTASGTPACSEANWEQAGNVDWGGEGLNRGAPIGTPPSMGPVNIGELPQTDQGWLDSQTALVTLTIGGNDARFSDIVAACSETDNIVSFDGNGCSSSGYYLTRTDGVVDPLPLDQMEPAVISKLEAHIAAVLNIIAQEAPNALILVLGYPRPFPGDLSAGPCSGDAAVDFIAPDTEFLNQMADDLDQTISQAVTGANAQSGGGRIHYLDTNAAFEGHRVCDSSPYLNGIITTETSNSGSSTPGSDSFHPTVLGQQALAGVVNAFLAGN